MVRAESYGYLLCHHAISALICAAATEADIDPDRIKFQRAIRIVRRRVAGPVALSPEQRKRSCAAARAEIVRKLNPRRRHRAYPRSSTSAPHDRQHLDQLTLSGIATRRARLPS